MDSIEEIAAERLQARAELDILGQRNISGLKMADHVALDVDLAKAHARFRKANDAYNDWILEHSK